MTETRQVIEALIGAEDGGTVTDLRDRLGRALGLAGPAPDEVFRRAVDDPGFAANLLACRGTPGFLRALFDAPATRAYVTSATEAGNRELVARAAGAFVRWGRAGFSTVDEEVLARREAACLSCPQLIEPTVALQRLIPAAKESDRLGSRTGRRVCALCGCTVSRKMRLPTESCPGRDALNPALTRWGEPVPEA